MGSLFLEGLIFGGAFIKLGVTKLIGLASGL